MNTVGIDREMQVGHTNNRVAHLLFVWVALVMIAGCGNDAREAGAMSETVKREAITSVSHIDDIFTLEREVFFTDSIFIAHYTYLDINANGDFLLTDLIGKQVVLFDSNGHHKKTLSTEPCNSGFPWHPYQARFKPDGNIIINSSQWGYEFSNEGDCIDELNDEFGFPKSMGFDDRGHIYGFYVHGQQDRGYHITRMNQYGKKIRSFGFDKKYFWYTMRNSPVPDIVVDKNGFIYHAKIFSPKVDKYDKKGNLIMHMGNEPDHYREIQLNDSEFALDNDSRSASIKYNDKFSLTRSLSLLNDETIMLKYSNDYTMNKDIDKSSGLVIMDLEGNDLIGTDILTHIDFIIAKNDLAYSFYDSTNIGKRFIVGDPSLKIYRYLSEPR